MKNPLDNRPSPAQRHFNRFMEVLQKYLYENGWYTQSHYIGLKVNSFKEAEEYLALHCYDKRESKRIVSLCKNRTRSCFS